MAEPRYSSEPDDPGAFTRSFDRFYTASAGLYAWSLRVLPFFRRWIEQAVPHLAGPRVLEVSFGTGHLLTRYADRFETHGVDLNRRMTRVASEALARTGARAALVRASVEHLPYPDGCFDSVVNTMAFTGYPDGVAALTEMKRVLRHGGRLVVVDVGPPADGNWLGAGLCRLWQLGGDLIRDMGELFRRLGFRYTVEEIGGAGSIQLYVATKP